MIIFEELRYKNLLSTGNVFIVIDLTRSPNTLVIGENGSGKSTMLDALCYVLFGKPFRKINIPQLVSSINEKRLLVEIDFRIGRNKYLVRRGIKPKKFEIWKNDKLLNQPGSPKDYQLTLEKTILKLNYKSFTQIVVLGNSSFIPFMQLTALNRRIVIEDLLDIEIFSMMNKLLKQRVETNRDDIKDTDYQIDLMEDKLGNQEDYIQEIKTSSQKKIDSITKDITGIKESIKKHSKEIKKLEIIICDLKSGIEDEKKTNAKLKKFDDYENRIKGKIVNIARDIEFFKKNENCPTCHQGISKDFRTKEIDAKTLSMEKVNDGLKELDKEITKTIARLNEIALTNEDIIVRNGLITGHNAEVSAQNNQVTRLNDEFKKLKKTKGDLTKARLKLRKFKVKLKALETRKETLIYQRNINEMAQVLLKDDGVKAKIIKQYVPVMNKLIAKYLAMFEFFVGFELDENFNEVIKSRHRDEFTYASFSEGEKMRIDLALLLTWRSIAKMKNSTNTNLLILDEVFDASLDSTGCEEFMKLIYNFGTETNIFIISHKGDTLSDKFKKTIRFERVKNFSRIAA